MGNKKGSALMVILLVILILLVIGLWFYPNFTKDAVTGAITKVRKIIP
jgi:competence protein ComGC